MEGDVVRNSTVNTAMTRWNADAADRVTDSLAVEEPLEIQLAYGARNARHLRSISVTMRTPGDDLNLAVGFLLTEGVVRDADDIASIRYVTAQAGDATAAKGAVLSPDAAGNIVRVELAPDVDVALATLERNFYATSSCGLCGKASLLALQTVCPPRTHSTFRIARGSVVALPAALRAAQRLFDQTGGLHGAGLFNSTGMLQNACEDVGRHNAVDKLLGAEFRAGRTPLRERLLMLSGRCSFELMQKALMAGIPAVAAVGAPSSLAVEVARRFDMLLIGFLRGGRFNVYSGVERIESVGEIA